MTASNWTARVSRTHEKEKVSWQVIRGGGQVTVLFTRADGNMVFKRMRLTMTEREASELASLLVPARVGRVPRI